MKLAEFTRTMWVSDEAEKIWKPMIAKIQDSFFMSRKGDKLESVLPENLDAWTQRFPGRLVILGKEGINPGTYSNQSVEYKPGDRYQYRVAITDSPKVWLQAWIERDDRKIGELLGYPDCCIEFFNYTWIKQGHRDTTPFMKGDPVNSPPMTNMFLRQMGVRLVSHLPCSYQCPRSIKIGTENLLRMVGSREWIEKLLSMPVEYSILHGVAEIKTPLFKVMTNSVEGPKQVIRKFGWFYPEEGAKGTRFPYNVQTKLNPQDNGFSDSGVMAECHAILLSELCAGSVLDLGCGNGLLLRKIHERLGGSIAGVEMDDTKAITAHDLNPTARIYKNNIKHHPFNEKFGTILIANNRLVEIGDALFETLWKFCTKLIVYSYDGEFDSRRFSRSPANVQVTRGVMVATYRGVYDLT